MSQVLQFLEHLGRHGPAAHLDDGEFATAVAGLDVDPAQRQALLGRDAGALAGLLGGRPLMLCSIFPADEPQREDEDAPDQQPDETPQEEER